MTNVVSFTDFRKNLSEHIESLKKGNEVIIRNEKKDENLVTLVAKKEETFNWDAHLKWMKSFKPFWTEEDTKAFIERRRKSRLRLKKLDW